MHHRFVIDEVLTKISILREGVRPHAQLQPDRAHLLSREVAAEPAGEGPSSGPCRSTLRSSGGRSQTSRASASPAASSPTPTTSSSCSPRRTTSASSRSRTTLQSRSPTATAALHAILEVPVFLRSGADPGHLRGADPHDRDGLLGEPSSTRSTTSSTAMSPIVSSANSPRRPTRPAISTGRWERPPRRGQERFTGRRLR
jgi:hypothetical protein